MKLETEGSAKTGIVIILASLTAIISHPKSQVLTHSKQDFADGPARINK